VLRLSKITDYGILVLSHLARGPHAATHNAREIAGAVELPLPVVSKLLKVLARAGVLESRRGSKGGFALTRRPEELRVTEMIEALDGPVALTECSGEQSLCQRAGSCAVRAPLQVINTAVENTLATITLADLINPAFPETALPLGQGDARIFATYPEPEPARAK
jgi:FeS assembly SUF system regulator